MTIVLGLFNFLIAFIAVFTTIMLILNVINYLVNPPLDISENNKVIDKDENLRYWLMTISSAAWAFIIAY